MQLKSAKAFLTIALVRVNPSLGNHYEGNLKNQLGRLIVIVV